MPAAVALAPLGCGNSQPPPEPQLRSPSYDYREAPRSGDDKVLGAHEQPPGDWVDGTVTNRHLGPGWEIEDGQVVPRPEQRNAGAEPTTTPASTLNPTLSPTLGDAGAGDRDDDPSAPPSTN